MLDGFRRVDGCVDYRTYVYPMDPAMAEPAFARLRRRLEALGLPEPERMGVTYVRAHWGFLVIPRPGFPELRVSLFRETPSGEAEQVFDAVRAACESMACARPMGDENE